MPTIIQKAWILLRTRPLQVKSAARQYFLFSLTGWLQKIFYTPAAGIFLSENVRIQKLACLFAERPGAEIHVGRDSVIYENARIQAYGMGKIEIGEGCIIGDARIYSRSRIQIGARVVTSWNVFIQDFDPHPIEPAQRLLQMKAMTSQFRPSRRKTEPVQPLDWKFPVSDVEIGENVWIGANVTILRGARIGKDSIIATGAVVTAGEYPARSLLAGVPAKLIKTI